MNNDQEQQIQNQERPALSIDAEYRALTRFEKWCMVCMLVAEIVIAGIILGGIK